MFRDLVAAILSIWDEDKKKRMFFEDISDTKWSEIRVKVRKFFSHKIWEEPRPEIDAQLKVNDISSIKQTFDREGLTLNWTLGFEEA